MKILMIGGTGFVGSYLAARLLKDGHEVTILIRSSKEARGASSGVSFRSGQSHTKGSMAGGNSKPRCGYQSRRCPDLHEMDGGAEEGNTGEPGQYHAERSRRHTRPTWRRALFCSVRLRSDIRLPRGRRAYREFTTGRRLPRDGCL